MRHRHLNHADWTLAAMDSCITRGRPNDWSELRAALRDSPALLAECALMVAGILDRGRGDPEFLDAPVYEAWNDWLLAAGRPLRLLFLDDSRLRRDEFALRHQGCEIVYASTAAEARAALAGARFDVAHLDHDLEAEHFLEVSGGLRDGPLPGEVAPNAGTGMDVVEFILAMPEEARPRRVVVHTHNPVGLEMLRRLLAGGAAADLARF